jgi:hypothetical protein
MTKLKFISDDKKIITLPVPLGSKVYYYNLTCFDGCIFQKELFDRVYPKDKGGRCGSLPCYIEIHGIREIELNLHNIHLILEKWEEKFFSSKAEARIKAMEIIELNKKELQRQGFSL